MYNRKNRLNTFICLLIIFSTSLIFCLPAVLFPPSQVLAQIKTDRKAEADRLFQQGIKQLETSQFEAALQSCRQALIIYREIKDRQG